VDNTLWVGGKQGSGVNVLKFIYPGLIVDN